MKDANQARAVTDGALVDHGQKAFLRHPRHLVGFVKIRRRADVVSTSSNEDVVLTVSDADGWLELERLLDLADTPIPSPPGPLEARHASALPWVRRCRPAPPSPSCRR